MFLTTRFFVLTAAVAVISAIGFLWTPVYWLALVLLALLFAATVGDAVLTGMGVHLSGSREVEDRLSLGAQNSVRVAVRNLSRVPTHVKLLDESPHGIAASELPNSYYILRPGRQRSLHYALTPSARGVYRFGRLLAFARSFVGLWERRLVIAPSCGVKVYPEFRKLREREMQYRLQRDVRAGRRIVRTVNHATEFEEIREFVRGDDFRRINWKATARRNDVMVNHYSDERAQIVYAIIDHGRQMQRRFEGMTLVDHAVNAALQLSFTAMNNDDLAGLVTFGHGMPVVVPPRKGTRQLHLLIEQLYRLRVKYAESDFSQLASVLAARAPRHALMMLFSDFYTLDALRRQLPHLRRIAKRHALVVVFFEDAELSDHAAPLAPSVKGDDRITHALTADLVLQKQQMMDLLQRNGIHALLTRPEQLSGNAVRRYFAMKKRGAW